MKDIYIYDDDDDSTNLKGKAVPLQARGFQEVKIPRFHDNGTGWW